MDEQLRRRSVGAPAARSLLLTVLGEFVLPRRASVWQETLVAALESVGYTQHAARRALARSTRDGWLATERCGRRARMSLTDPTAELLRTGAERIYSFGQPWEWDGRWLVVVLRVPEQRRAVRHQATSFVASLGSIGDPQQLVDQGWELDRMRAQYTAFIDHFSCARPSGPQESFRVQTLLVHAWRKFPFLDPDLPASLLPAHWPRDRAQQLFADRHERWRLAAGSYFEQLEEGLGATAQAA